MLSYKLKHNSAVHNDDGNLLRDAYGNIIVTPTGNDPTTRRYQEGKAEVIITYNEVFVYANDGSKHLAYVTTVSTVDGKDVTELAQRLTYDCHGLTQTDGDLFIDSGDPIEGLLKGDRYINKDGILPEKPIEQAQKGDVIIFRDKKNNISHTAIFNDDEACTCDTKNGWARERETNMPIKDVMNIYGNKVTALAPKKEDLILGTLQKAPDGTGITYYSSSNRVVKALNLTKTITSISPSRIAAIRKFAKTAPKFW